jgi:cell division septation protein DedD
MANGKKKKQRDLSLDGRGIAIAITAVVSGACFALGFFVGQATTRNSAPEMINIAPATPSEAASKEIPAGSEPPGAVEPWPADVSRPPLRSEKKPAPEAAPRTAVKSRGVYSVQIAAFENRKDAEAMQRKYKLKGYTSYIYKTRTEQKTMYKVRVGKFKNREYAESLALKLKDDEGVTTFVTHLAMK